MASPNRQYESMLTVARERLSRHAPESIARRAGVTWDGGRLLQRRRCPQVAAAAGGAAPPLPCAGRGAAALQRRPVRPVPVSAPLPPVAAAVVRGRGISRVGTAVSGRERRPLPDGGGCGNGGRPAAGAAGRRPSTGLEERSGYAQICSDPGFLQGHAVLS